MLSVVLMRHACAALAGTGQRGVRRASCLVAAVLSPLWAVALRAQSMLDRPPNVSGNWVGHTGTVYFNFVHRFAESGPPDHKVTNAPTFLVATGIASRGLVGFNYATNSQLAARSPNEWEFFTRFAALVQDDGAPFDIAGQAGYNIVAEGVDGELSAARREGPVRVIAAARVLADPFEAGKTRFALAGGGTIRLTRWLALAGDAATLMNRRENERLAWSAGLHLALPSTPHTLSLHMSNTITTTLQGATRGGDKARFGFEFTVPITLRRFFGGGEQPAVAEVPGAQVSDTTSISPDTTVARDRPDSIAPARAPRDAIPVPTRTDSAARARAPRDTVPAPARADSDARAERPPRAPVPSGPAAPRKPPARVTAAMRGMAFTPRRIEIAAGGTVTWRNNDQLPHTVTANDASFSSPMILAGGTWSHTFSKPGTYAFYCTPHPFMRGVIVVR